MIYSSIWESQVENLSKTVPYGIPFLDDATNGILPGQLIVLGAATGVGKTDALSLIARAAAVKAKVCFLALEAHENEIQERILYRAMADIYFKLPSEKKREMGVGTLSYVDFHSGKLNKALGEFWDEAMHNAMMITDNIDFVYPSQLSAEGAAIEIERRVDDGTRLFILDHLHHLEIDEQDEVKALKRNMKLLNLITNSRECSLLTASHLRKGDRMRPEFPDLNDLHGSSEISKRAHVVIILGPVPRNQHEGMFAGQITTLFHVAKFRL